MPKIAVHDRLTTPLFHFIIFLSLLPVGMASSLAHGPYTALVILVTLLTTWGADVLLSIWKKEKRQEDGSAFLWGLLIAYIMPVHVFILIPIMGALFAVWGIKGLLGGSSWINPVLGAGAFCSAAWPNPVWWHDAVTGATPLSLVRESFLKGDSSAPLAIVSAHPHSPFDQGLTEWLNNHLFSLFNVNLPGGYIDVITGASSGIIGGGGHFLLLVATVFLLARRLIPWEIPLGYFMGFAVPLVGWGLFMPQTGGTPDLLFHIFSGTFLLGTFFLATDTNSRPLSFWGRGIYALACGFFTFLLRQWGVVVDGVLYAILLVNCFVPLLDMIKRKNKRFLIN